MALVNGPLFSLEAAGQVGKAIVFSKWKGRDYVRQYVVPANPRSLSQQFQRGILGALSKWWASIAASLRDDWEDLAALGNYSDFNAYCKYNLDLEAENSLIVPSPSGSGAAPAGTLTGIAGTGGAGTVAFTVTPATSLAATDLLMVTLGTESGAASTANTIQRTVASRANVVGTGVFAGTLMDIPAGDYYISARIVGQDGTATAWTDSAAAITVT